MHMWSNALIRHSDHDVRTNSCKSEPGRKVMPAFANSPQFLSLAISNQVSDLPIVVPELLFEHRLLAYIFSVVLGQGVLIR